MDEETPSPYAVEAVFFSECGELSDGFMVLEVEVSRMTDQVLGMRRSAYPSIMPGTPSARAWRQSQPPIYSQSLKTVDKSGVHGGRIALRSPTSAAEFCLSEVRREFFVAPRHGMPHIAATATDAFA